MSYSLNSLNGDYIGDYYRAYIKRDTRSLDNGSDRECTGKLALGLGQVGWRAQFSSYHLNFDPAKSKVGVCKYGQKWECLSLCGAICQVTNRSSYKILCTT